MYFCGKGTQIAAVTLIAYVIITCLQPVFSASPKYTARPLNVDIKSVTSNQLIPEWSPLTCHYCNFEGYEVVLIGGRAIRNVTIVSKTAASTTFGDLRPCTTYNISLRYKKGPHWQWSPKSFVSATTTAKVHNATVIQSGKGSLTVSWDVDAECQDTNITYWLTYQLTRITPCDGITNAGRRSMWLHNDKRFRLTDLEDYATYKIQISINGTGDDSSSRTLTKTTIPADPDPVRNLRVRERNKKLTFSWLAPFCENIRGSFVCYNYKLVQQGHEDSGNRDCSEVTAMHITSKIYRIESLQACTNYTFKVEVITGTGHSRKRSGWTPIKIRTPTKAPGAPRIIEVAQLSDSVSDATVTWEAPTDNPCEAEEYLVTYKLLYKDMCGEPSDVTEKTRRVEHRTRQIQEFVMRGLFSHSLYMICVSGLVDDVQGTSSCTNFTSGPKEPARYPEGVKTTFISYDSLMFSWEKPLCGYRNGPITHYEYIFNANGSNVLIPGNVTGDENGGDVTFDDLIPATTYSFSVRANIDKLSGPYSHLEANTDTAVYHPPNDINVTVWNETTAVVKWNTPAQSSDFSITGYRIEAGNSSRKATLIIFVPCDAYSCPPDGLLVATITELTPATKYYLQVIAEYKYGENASGQLVFKTPSEVVGSSSRASGKTMIPVVAIIFVIIIVLLFVVASQLYSRKTNKQLFKWPELFVFSLPGILNSLRGTDTTTRGSAQTPNNHTTRDVNGDGMEMNVTCDVSQSDNHACNSEMESDLSPAIYENVTSQTRKHTAIPVGQLLGYVARKNAGGFGSFDADFKSLPSNDLHSQDIASQESNKEKNRFKNILPYDHSRVKLSVLNDDPSSDYINASFIDGYRKPKKYIAGQGPNTASMDDFWRMVWQYNSRKIVMLTNLREANKKKCEKYWPARSDTFGGIVVTMAKEEIRDHYTVRYFNLVCNNTGRDVIQYHYTTWPDMGVPEYSAHLMNFLKMTRQISGQTIVHCSAGVGRTGTFLALDAMLDQVEAEQAVDIHSFIANMRQKRPLMVQTKKQYRFIYEALVQELTCGDTSIEQNVFTETYHSLLSKKKGTTVMQQQYELLEALTVNLQDEEVAAARTKENAGKNRFQDKVPAGRTRPFLMTAVEGSTDYINASFLPGCVSRNQYIGAQTPLPNTVADFWRLVVDYKVNTIVMLHGNSRDKTYAQYWNKEESTQYGSFKVQVIKEEYNRPIMFRTMEVTDTDSKKASSRTVKQFQLASCPPKSEVPPMADVMQLYKALISDAGSTDWKEGNSPLLIHCRDGEGITGAFCAFMSVMDHLNTKQTIDVFHACKRLRTSRPGAVATLAQYQFIYEAVKSCLMSTSIYENMAKIV